MKKWIIEGGSPLQGQIAVSGAKNVVVKLMIAALLTHEETILHNVPAVGDVETTAAMIRHLGPKVEYISPNSIRILANELNNYTIPKNLAEKSRASTIFIGPLLARCGEAQLPLPGGDRIGRRPLNWHYEGLKKLGAEIKTDNERLTAKALNLRGAEYRFPKNTHTGTETLILASVLAEGKTVLENASGEPEVDDLISMLTQMGAKIKRTAPRTIEIQGVGKLNGTSYTIMSDRNEQVSLSCMALATKGDILIEKARPKHLDSFLEKLTEMGAGIEVTDSTLHVWYKGKLDAIDVTTSPHPGFMTDWQPLLTTLLTQANGTSTVHETVFDRRFEYVDELLEMGARVKSFNPAVSNPKETYNFTWTEDDLLGNHAIKIYGPTQLHGIAVNVTDVRAGASLLQVALTAQGVTTIFGVEHIERGYERLVPRLQSLGANIKSEE